MYPGLSWKGLRINEQPSFCFQSCNTQTCSICFQPSAPGAGLSFLYLGKVWEAKILKTGSFGSNKSQAREVSQTDTGRELWPIRTHIQFTLCCMLVCRTALVITQVVPNAGNNWGQLLPELELLYSTGSCTLKTATQWHPLLVYSSALGTN